ncbi:MAG: hypothetical protein LBC59_01030, partial [Chitinispirillales bacterium]|nr:hypothetical protein [Chitinispirillales bacterium]
FKSNSFKIFKVKFFKSFLDEAFGFIGYAGLNPAYIKSKSKAKTTDFDFDFDVDSYAGFTPHIL